MDIHSRPIHLTLFRFQALLHGQTAVPSDVSGFYYPIFRHCPHPADIPESQSLVWLAPPTGSAGRRTDRTGRLWGTTRTPWLLPGLQSFWLVPPHRHTSGRMYWHAHERSIPILQSVQPFLWRRNRYFIIHLLLIIKIVRSHWIFKNMGWPVLFHFQRNCFWYI